jgi:hypothetical protein
LTLEQGEPEQLAPLVFYMLSQRNCETEELPASAFLFEMLGATRILGWVEKLLEY